MTMNGEVVLVTDSPDPSGVGAHMLTLAAALPPPWRARLLFPDHGAGRDFAARAGTRGLSAATVPEDGWEMALAGAGLVHVHAGIGWEGHGLVRAAHAAGARVVRTEHLPWLVTDPSQRAEYEDAARLVDAVIAVSRASAHSWRPVIDGMPGPRLPLACVPNGVEALAPTLAPMPLAKRKGDTILCVARFTPQKNHAVLLGAMARLARVRPGAVLLLVGEGPEEDRMRRRAARLGLADRVRFLGRRDDVPALMTEADLLVLPSAFEGLPLVVLEAMAAGLPVVASRIGGVVEALGPEHPWLVPPGDRRTLASALSDALGDGPARAEAARRQRERYHGFYGAGRMGADTARIYAAALRGGAGERTMGRTRLGFVGAGGIAHRHFGVLETMEDVEIAAVADPDPERAAEAARRTRARAYASAGEMLAAEKLDAVYICVPPFAHGPVERLCLAAGLPFFVEKPLSLDLATAEEIAAEVERTGTITATGYHWRYLDTVDEARARLMENPAHLMTGFWLDSTPPPRWWWREDGSGGQVVEQATHLIDLARFLAGDVAEVQAMAARREREGFDGLDVPTATTATLRFAGGAVATLSATCLLGWNHRVGLHVFADRLAMEITDHDIMIDTGQGRPVRGAQGDPVWREDRDFVDAVRGGENRIRAPYAEALETHRIALAVSRAAATGTPQELEAPRSDPRPPFRAGHALAGA